MSPVTVHLPAKRRQPFVRNGLIWLALAAIRFYQRYISPYKGYACTYRVHLDRASCSALGFRAIRRHGLWRGIEILRMRFERCAEVHRRYGQRPFIWRRQAGFCDAGCDLPCELPFDIDLAGCAGDVLMDALPCDDCGSCGPSRKRRDAEYAVRIPARKAGK